MDINQGIILDMLPMPPSENEAYPTDFKTGRRFVGKEMAEYKQRFQAWSLRRALEIAKIQNQLKWELADHRRAIKVDAFLFFQYESLFTKVQNKTDRPRRKQMNDPSNRGKPLYDCLATMLGVDDSRMVPGGLVPVIRTNPQGQYVMVTLGLTMIQTDEELFQSMNVQQKI